MKKLQLLTVGCAVMLASLSANALTITPLSLPSIIAPDGTSPKELKLSDVISITGDSDLELLYKQDVGGGEGGSYGGHYSTTFQNTPTDPADATITFDGTSSISSDPLWLFIKDGNNLPVWYFFDLAAMGWNGTETINLQGFWPGNGAISHVSIYGSGTPTTNVPDGGSTLMLLGAAFGSLGFARRFIKR